MFSTVYTAENALSEILNQGNRREDGDGGWGEGTGKREYLQSISHPLFPVARTHASRTKPSYHRQDSRKKMMKRSAISRKSVEAKK